MPYKPQFTYTSGIVSSLEEISRHKEFADNVQIPPAADLRLRHAARKRSTHSSTLIEGNPIAQESISATISDRSRNPSEAQMEVRNYWHALEWISEKVQAGSQPSEEVIRSLHAIIMAGTKGQAGRRKALSEYRSGQMVIRDSVTDQIVYMATEPQDVPQLMTDLVEWWKGKEAGELPTPVRAAIIAYRFVTIHPFDDGNGRTTRALATFELWRGSYSFRGYLALEDYYARDLDAYYNALQMGLHHNFYFGRNEADLTPWIEYFVSTLLEGAREVRSATEAHLKNAPDIGANLDLTRRLESLVSRVISLSVGQSSSPVEFTPTDVSDWFGVSDKTAREWLTQWRDLGYVEPASGSERVRSWRLAGELREATAAAIQEEIEEVQNGK